MKEKKKGYVVENVHFFRRSIKQTSKVSYGNKGCRVQGVGGREKRKKSKDQEGCGLQVKRHSTLEDVSFGLTPN